MARKKRQRRGEKGDEKDPVETSVSTTPASATTEQESDPDGTLNVARGVFHPQDQEKLLEQLSEKQKEQAERHLQKDDLALQRRQQLQYDDSHSSTSKLTAQQQRHLKHRKNKKVTIQLQRLETKRYKAALNAVQAVEILQDNDAQAGLLEAETDLERTTAVTQTQLKRLLPPAAAQEIYDLQLPAAPYRMHYDRTGRYALLTGTTPGHVAVLDAAQKSLVTEFHLPNERLRDAVFLHNHTLLAVAQRHHVYIYDDRGAEIHCLHDHSDPQHLQFLPYHWLLASTGRAGYLKYQDTSTGQLVSQHRMNRGMAATCLRPNPSNAVLHAGHPNGTVTLWSPAHSQYLAQMQCHKGAAVTDLAVDLEGRTLVTAGMDRQVRVWDLRMYRQRHSYFCSAGTPQSIDLSQRNLLAVGHAGHVTVWGADALQQKVKSPYLHHRLGPAGDNRAVAPVETVRFRPFEDVCGVGHAAGVSSMVVPGSGEPALDTAELNPLQDTKQRREAEVRSLLDKLSPDMIALDADAVGGMEASDPTTRLERLQDLQQDADSKPAAPPKKKNKKRGRSKIQTQLRRKHKNIVDQNTLRLKEAREQEIVAKQQQQAEAVGKKNAKPLPMLQSTNNDDIKESAPAALKRFF